MVEAAGERPTTESPVTKDGSSTAEATACEPAVGQDRVLIVDDNASFRSIARQVLTADGFLVVGEAAEGAEAIRACGVLGPDIVLLDIQLPDIDGFEVASVLAGLIDAPAVVLVSSRSRTDYGSRVGTCGARGFIAKAELSGDAIRRLLLAKRAPP